MQLMVKIGDRHEEWGLVELQGVLETHQGQSFDKQFIGDLHFTAAGVPQLIVGHHLLTGKVVKLDKPLAVMKKQAGEEDREEYIVVAVVNKKIIFRNRPKPLVGLKK